MVCLKKKINFNFEKRVFSGIGDNSGGVVVGALVRNIAGSNFALCFDFIFFSLVEIFLYVLVGCLGGPISRGGPYCSYTGLF